MRKISSWIPPFYVVYGALKAQLDVERVGAVIRGNFGFSAGQQSGYFVDAPTLAVHPSERKGVSNCRQTGGLKRNM